MERLFQPQLSLLSQIQDLDKTTRVIVECLLNQGMALLALVMSNNNDERLKVIAEYVGISTQKLTEVCPHVGKPFAKSLLDTLQHVKAAKSTARDAAAGCDGSKEAEPAGDSGGGPDRR